MRNNCLFSKPIYTMQLSQQQIKNIRSLHQSKFREERKQFIAEGLKTIYDLVAFGAELEYIIALPHIATNDMLKEITQNIYVTDEPGMKKISTLVTPPGIVGIFKLKEILKINTLQDTARCLVLDGISDPGNMGTMIRTAHWFGFHTIYLANHCVDIFSPKVVQSSMGSLTAIKYYQIESIEDWIKDCGNKNFPVLATAMSGESINYVSIPSAAALVMGSESHGLSEAWNCEYVKKITIPFHSSSHPESLNVSVAAAIMMERMRVEAEG